jgi:hypothetical protein
MIPPLPLRLRDEAMVLHMALVDVTPPGAHGETGGQSGWRSATGGRAAGTMVGAVGALSGSRTGGMTRHGVAVGAIGRRGYTGGY